MMGRQWGQHGMQRGPHMCVACRGGQRPGNESMFCSLNVWKKGLGRKSNRWTGARLANTRRTMQRVTARADRAMRSKVR